MKLARRPRTAAIEHSALVREKQPVLAEMESKVANVRVRATGTLGGNLCFAEPHSDPATLLLVLGATLRVQGLHGARELTLDKFIAGPYAKNLAPGEILTTIVVPCANTSHRAAYMKFQVHERPMLGLGLWLDSADEGSTLMAARVAVGCACPFPTRALGSRANADGRTRRSRKASAGRRRRRGRRG